MNMRIMEFQNFGAMIHRQGTGARTVDIHSSLVDGGDEKDNDAQEDHSSDGKKHDRADANHEHAKDCQKSSLLSSASLLQ